MRADRVISLYVARPLRRLLPAKRAGIPILMYHRVPKEDHCTGHPYYCTNTAVDVFEQQIRFLRDHGYEGVTVSEAARLANGGTAGKCVSITFDDGYQDFYSNAFPVLSRYGYSATVFLPTAYIAEQPHCFRDHECLNWSQVQELRRAGIEFGSHTVTHPQLSTVDTAQLRLELHDSKQEIEQRLGEPVGTFAYPYAFPETNPDFVRLLEAVLQESGYYAGVSTVLGRASRADKSLFLKRLPVNTHDDPQFFESKLVGDYDWLHLGQFYFKIMKSLVQGWRHASATE